MAKKNSNVKPKAFEEAWSKVSHHFLLGAILSLVNLHALEDNSPVWKDINIKPSGFGLVRVYKDFRAEMYIRKSNKFHAEEWAFVFATLAVYLGLDLYKKYSEKNLFVKQGLILFSMHYVKNTLNFQEVPKAWESFFELENAISFKNETSVIEQLKNNPDLLGKTLTIGFLNDANEVDIELKNEIGRSYTSWSSNKAFADIFVDNLIEQAQRTIALRSSRNITEDELKKKSTLGYKAKHWFEHHYPLLASLSASFKIVEDIQICKQFDIQIAAVSAVDKIIYINPLAQLNEMGTRFVIAHEILHIALDHARRRAGRDPLIWNLACDFVINHWLVEMNIGISPEGLFFDKSLAGKSADEIYLMIASDVRLKKKMMTLKDMRAGEGSNKKGCDMLDQDPAYFSEFADACKEALLRGVFMHQSCGRGDLPADLVEEIKAINQPAIPWQVELAQWLAQRFPLDENRRSYARPSRRQSSTPDIARPSYIKPFYESHTRTYGVILDTSGSMDKQLIGKCLGAIASYSAAQEVKEVRLIFCDAQPYDEGFVPIEMLAHKVKVKGRGGTVLQQAVNYLQNCHDFPDDAPILILTDGGFEENLKVEREHAFLVPNKAYMPLSAKNVFEFK
jgi:predicted metal-dependent peptidase